MRRGRWIAAAVLGLALGAGLVVAGDDEERDGPVDEKDVPAAVLRTARRFSEGGKLESCKLADEDGLGVYELVFRKGDREIEVKTTKTGELFATEEKVDEKHVPAAVRERAARLFKPGSDVTYERSYVLVYEVSAKDEKGHEVELLVNQAGAAFREVAPGVREERREKPGEGSARPFLGIQFREGDDCVVGEVIEGTAASKAGLRAGDRIVSFDGNKVASAQDLVKLVQSHAVGDKVKLTVERDGWQKVLVVALGARPADAEKPGAHEERREKPDGEKKGEDDDDDDDDDD